MRTLIITLCLCLPCPAAELVLGSTSISPSSRDNEKFEAYQARLKERRSKARVLSYRMRTMPKYTTVRCTGQVLKYNPTNNRYESLPSRRTCRPVSGR